MSLSHKDPNDDKEPDLKRGPSAPARARTQSPPENKRKATLRQRNSEGKVTYNRSESINGDDDPPYPVSEVERGHHGTQAGSLAVNPSSTVTGPGDGEVLDPANSRNPQSRLGKRPGDVDSGPGTSSDTGPIVTESDVLETQENRHSPTAAATAKPTTRKAPRARQARKTYGQAILWFGGIFGLIVTALTVSYATGYESPSVRLQKLYGPIFRAGVGVTSAYLWTYHATQQLYWRLPTIQPPSRNSSGEVLGAGLGDIYSNLSEALDASNSLNRVPSLISEKRRQATRFRLPQGSLTAEPLLLFFRQSLDIDEDLIRLMLVLGQTASTALRQQQLTGDTLRSIQLVEYFGTFQAFRIRWVGTSTQESQLQTRLELHLRRMNETITDSDKAVRDVLGRFIVLASTAETIRNSSIQDRERLLWIKEETASQRFWVFRASIYVLRFSEPEDLAKISQNIELADSIYEWAQDIVNVLQRATFHLQCAKTIVGSLMETLAKFGTVTWDVADKDRKIQEFLALIWEGQQLLTGNREAFIKLQFAGLL